MPFASEQQRKYLYARHPKIAARWTAEAKAKKEPAVTKRYAQAGTVGRRQDMAKGFARQSLSPTLARRLPKAGRKALVDGAVTKGVLADVAMAMRGASGPASKPASAAVNTMRAVKTKPAAAAAAGAAGGMVAGRASKRDFSEPERSKLAAKGKANPGGSFPIKSKQDARNALADVRMGRGTPEHRAEAMPRIKAELAKRRFDPEDERRHRQGLEAGALGTGGALAMGYGIRDVKRDTKTLARRGFDPGQPPQMDAGPFREGAKFRPATPQENKGRVMAHAKELELYGARLKASRGVKRGGALVRGRSAALLGGGLAALAGASALHGQRRESRWD